MERNFSVSDAKQVCAKHQEMIEQFAQLKIVHLTYKDNLEQIAKRYVTSEVLHTLRTIPIDELNREKNGIRVKTLRENGFSTYANIVTSSTFQLSSIRGISEDAAYHIKRLVKDVAEETKKGTKLRLSIDHKTDDTTNIVVAISQYRKSVSLYNSITLLTKGHSSDISLALEEVTPSTNILKWFFASKEKKNKAIRAYEFLRNEMEGEYGTSFYSILQEEKKLGSLSPDEAWNEFSSQSIAFSKTLEEVVPGLLGNDDSLYGLPEDLARKVQDECFFPDGLLCELRNYQEWGVKYILHQGRVLLGDEMGLGKTIQAIATMVSLKNTGATHFVVVCPASVIINWCREIQKFSRLRVIKVHGSDRLNALKDWVDNGGVAVTTYETTAYFKLPDDFGFTLLVVDEAHYIKNPGTNRTIYTKALCAHAERLLFMTGTALENNVDEMISLIRLLQPSIAYEIAGMTMLTSAPQFREKIAPVYYRRKREDVLTELPELLEQKEWCQMSPVEEQVYEETVLNRDYNGARRVSWNIEDLVNSSKANRMLEIIEQAKAEGRKILVFSFYLDTIHKIVDMLGSRCMEPINGSVSPSRRQEIIDDFEKADAGKVLALQIGAGGTGLNIQSASVVILCEPQLKPSVEQQAISRAYRMGQARNVLVHRLLCVNSIDEKITGRLEEKQEIFNAFADKSVAADNVEVDSQSLGNMILEEIDRINEKRKEV